MQGGCGSRELHGQRSKHPQHSQLLIWTTEGFLARPESQGACSSVWSLPENGILFAKNQSSFQKDLEREQAFSGCFSSVPHLSLPADLASVVPREFASQGPERMVRRERRDLQPQFLHPL